MNTESIAQHAPEHQFGEPTCWLRARVALGHCCQWSVDGVHLQDDLAVADLRPPQHQPDQFLALEGHQTAVDLAELAQRAAHCVSRHSLAFDLLERFVNFSQATLQVVAVLRQLCQLVRKESPSRPLFEDRPLGQHLVSLCLDAVQALLKAAALGRQGRLLAGHPLVHLFGETF